MPSRRRAAHEPGWAAILHVSTTGEPGGVGEAVRSELPCLAESGWRPRWGTANELDEAHDTAFVLHNAVLPEGPATRLDRSRTDGAELFGGRWQKLALGRASMQDGPLLMVPDGRPPPSTPRRNTPFPSVMQLKPKGRRPAADDGIMLLVSHHFSTVGTDDLVVVIEGPDSGSRGPRHTAVSRRSLRGVVHASGPRLPTNRPE
ncbi:hypothetical protein [Streptomyces sp. AC558_RSS880]|uniref:hypothetical protein n=1 Tax=Streptomyces sp. AC558_RSS880 TaxID=2823687 RepID=UPI001C23D987|nr:hypothetical protein [Streptomyces sp. AC558_RSS880]